MADEKFQKILEKVADASKKSGAGQSKQALAVQIVDKTGKIEGGKAGSVEQEREKATQSKNQTSFLKRIAEGISNIPGAAGDVAAGAAESMFDKLKKALIGGAIMVLIAAVVGFLNSEAWVKLKKFFVEDLLPWAKMIYEDFLKPIGEMLWGQLKKAWDAIKKGFTGVADGFEKLFNGDIIGGLLDIWLSLATFFGSILDIGITSVYNIIAKVFGLEETDSVFGSIKKFFVDLYDDIVFWIKSTWNSITTTIAKVWTDVKNFFINLFTWGEKEEGGSGTWTLKTFITGIWESVKGWFTKLFSWAGEEDPKESWIITTIKKTVLGVKKWFGDLFKFDSTSNIITSVINIAYFLPNLVLGGLKLITEWLLGLFGFDEKAKKLANAKNWSIGGMIVGAFKEVKKWIVGLFTWGKKAGETAEGGFSLMKIIGDVIQKVWDWFKGLLDIDIKAIANSIPGAATLIGWMTTSKEEAAAEAAKEFAEMSKNRAEAAAAREKEIEKVRGEKAQSQMWIDTKGEKGKARQFGIVSGSSATDIKDEEKQVKKSDEKLKELIAQNEKAKALDMEFKKKATTESPTSSIFTHDSGLHDRLDGLTKQMFKPTLGIVISDKSIKDLVEAIAGGGGSTNVDASTVNMSSAPTTTIGQANSPRQRVAVNG